MAHCRDKETGLKEADNLKRAFRMVEERNSKAEYYHCMKREMGDLGYLE